MSTSRNGYTRWHGEAARVYIDRCRQANDQRSPLLLLGDLVGRDQALRLLPHVYEAKMRAGEVLRPSRDL